MSSVQQAGSNEIKVREIADQLGLKPNRVHTWFSVPGKDQRGSARPLTVGPD